jgi:enamine deaminase RidA (YjgF/YER057c/UK114 family)
VSGIASHDACRRAAIGYGKRRRLHADVNARLVRYPFRSVKQFRNPETVHPPLAAYAHQVEVGPNERLLVMSGQVGMHPNGTLPADPVDQLDAALENVERNLAAAGLAVGDLVKLTIYVVGEMDAARRRAVVAARLGQHQPCMTLVFVAGLAAPAYAVEVDAWASANVDA